MNPGLRSEAGADPVRLDFKLAPLATVTGRVLGPDGKPLAGAMVTLVPNILGGDLTDAEGRFTIPGVRPNPYLLFATPPETAQPVKAKDGSRTGMLPTYYPSVADPSLAQHIPIGNGGPDGFEIRIQTSLVHRIRGVVLNEDGKLAPGVELTIRPAVRANERAVGLSIRPGGRSLFAIGIRVPQTATSTDPTVSSRAPMDRPSSF